MKLISPLQRLMLWGSPMRIHRIRSLSSNFDVAHSTLLGRTSHLVVASIYQFYIKDLQRSLYLSSFDFHLGSEGSHSCLVFFGQLLNLETKMSKDQFTYVNSIVRSRLPCSHAFALSDVSQKTQHPTCCACHS